MTSIIGSVFLGDSTRHRVRSTSSKSSTPPSSPPGTAIPAMFPGFPPQSPPPVSNQKGIEPGVALEIRLRWLEAIVYGMRKGKEPEKRGELKSGETLSRAADSLQHRLQGVVENHDGLKKFMSSYDQHAHYLTPSFALSGVLPEPPSYENMTADELDAFLAEMESDIRAADRDMLEIDQLNKKGVTGAGKLAEYENLQPRLDAVLKLHQQNRERAVDLEERIARLVEQHATHIDALSELFVAWDDAITDVEARTARMEREEQERKRLGL